MGDTDPPIEPQAGDYWEFKLPGKRKRTKKLAVWAKCGANVLTEPKAIIRMCIGPESQKAATAESA